MNWLPEKIFSYLFHKKKTLLLVLFFVFLGILIPNHTAHAQWYNFLIGAITFVPMALIGVGLSVIILLSGLLAAFGGVVLNWVLSPTFINWSYTNPATNPIIKIGLDITQPFVNMILILVLVFIALATILRLGGYETKKLLPTFIIVALLVNFAPVICGLIVDASNIVMNFFTQNITGGKQLISTLKALGDSWFGLMGPPTAFEATTQMSLVLNLVVLIIVNLALFLILLLFAFVFMVRYLAIWTLVILSPLAFACYILPATNKIWKLWWNQLLQWSIIGITMAFFLYLADQFTVLNPILTPQGTTIATTTSDTATNCYTCTAYEGSRYNSLEECQTPCNEALGLGACELCTSTSTPIVTGIGGAILPSLLPVVFLYLGFMFGLSTGAMGASGVIGLAKGAGKWTGAKVWRGASTWAQEKTKFRETAGAVTKKWEEIPVARWFLPEKMRKYAEMRPAIDEAQKKLSIHSSPEVSHRAAVGDIYGKDAVGGLMEVIERGDSNDWIKEHARANGINPDTDKDYEKKLDAIPEYREKMARLFQIARSGGRHNSIIRAAPRLAEFAVDAGLTGYKDIPGNLAKSVPDFDKLSQDEKREKIRGAAIAMAVDESRTQHVKNWEREDILDKAVVSKTMERGEDFQRAIFTQVKKGHGVVLETVAEIFKDFAKEKGEPIDSALWGKFRKDFSDKHEGKEGFFLYLDSPQAKRQGWTPDLVIKMAGGAVSTGGAGGGTGGGRRGRGRRKGTKSPTAGGATGMGEQSEPSEGPQD